jgi:hypothetical protein
MKKNLFEIKNILYIVLFIMYKNTRDGGNQNNVANEKLGVHKVSLLSQGSATLLGHLLPNKSKLPITACKAV